ncbi:MAG: potassium-transporting ATPase subunit KdpC [Myxococcales bacterium]|nr:potassium-transporting ATPase subunit KdpC [Myxococcales bacterium]
MFRQGLAAVRLLIVLSVLTGLIYPLLILGAARAFFPYRAGGSLIVADGAMIGSERIGQAFSSPRYFWGRPSATAPFPYNAAASAGSNLGPLNPALENAVRSRLTALREADPDNAAPVPVDLVTASGSGLDPEISPAAAFYQAGRVARARGLSRDAVADLIRRLQRGRQCLVLGETRVNVLRLNLALDELERNQRQ